jgi:hypothetical protein
MTNESNLSETENNFYAIIENPVLFKELCDNLRYEPIISLLIHVEKLEEENKEVDQYQL